MTSTRPHEAQQERTRRPRARRLPPAERRARLLTCALRVFARRGLGEGRHAEIAEEAEVALSTVFFYFPTRSALVAAVLDEVERFYGELGDRIHADTESPAARVILSHARAFADSVDSHPDHARVWLDWSTSIRDAVWPRYLDFQERIVALIARTIERGRTEGHLPADVEADDDARLIVGSAHMVAQLKFTHAAADRVERFLRTIVRAALGGATGA